MVQCPVHISSDLRNPGDTVQTADAGQGREVTCEERARATGAAQWLPDSGGGPGWHGRLLGGGGLSIVTRRAHDAGPPV